MLLPAPFQQILVSLRASDKNKNSLFCHVTTVDRLVVVVQSVGVFFSLGGVKFEPRFLNWLYMSNYVREVACLSLTHAHTNPPLPFVSRPQPIPFVP